MLDLEFSKMIIYKNDYYKDYSLLYKYFRIILYILSELCKIKSYLF